MCISFELNYPKQKSKVQYGRYLLRNEMCKYVSIAAEGDVVRGGQA